MAKGLRSQTFASDRTAHLLILTTAGQLSEAERLRETGLFVWSASRIWMASCEDTPIQSGRTDIQLFDESREVFEFRTKLFFFALENVRWAYYMCIYIYIC